MAQTPRRCGKQAAFLSLLFPALLLSLTTLPAANAEELVFQ
jgi:hypothetical protein